MEVDDHQARTIGQVGQLRIEPYSEAILIDRAIDRHITQLEVRVDCIDRQPSEINLDPRCAIEDVLKVVVVDMARLYSVAEASLASR